MTRQFTLLAATAIFMALFAHATDASAKGGGGRSGGSHGSRGGAGRSAGGHSGNHSGGGSHGSRQSISRRPSISNQAAKVLGGSKPAISKVTGSSSKPSSKSSSHHNGHHGHHGHNDNHGHHNNHHGHHDHHGNHHGHHGHHHDHHGHHHGHHHHHVPIRICLTPVPVFPTVTREVVVVDPVPPSLSAEMAETLPPLPPPADAKPAAKPAEKLPTVPVGATLTLDGGELGAKEGRVVLEIAGVSMPAKIEKWDGKSAVATLPVFGLAAPTKANVQVFKADATLASSVAVQLVPADVGSEAAPTAAEQSSAKKPEAAPGVGQTQVASN